MRDRIQQLQQRFSEWWRKLNLRQRQIYIAVSIAIPALLLVAIVVGVMARGGDRMGVLFADLGRGDAAAIVNELKRESVEYDLADEGRAILVKESMVNEQRLALAAKGLPQGSVVGFEIFDKTKMGQTDFTQQVNLQRAKEGQLTRTIESIESVYKAAVSLAIPEKSPFLENSEPPSASIQVTLKKGKELDAKQVRGIVNLVASAVPGLKPENITLVDSAGATLSDALKDDGKGGDLARAEQQIAMKAQLEKHYTDRLQEFMDDSYGIGNSKAIVTAELNFDEWDVEEMVYSPVNEGGDTGVALSEQFIEEKYLGTGQVPEIGVPGVPSNVPGYQGLTNGQAEYNRNEKTRNYDNSYKKENQKKNKGNIERLGVAVHIDENRIKESRGGGDDFDLEGEIGRIKAGVSAALAISSERGDTVEVITGFREPDRLYEQMLKDLAQKRLMRWVGVGLAFLSVLIIGLIFFLIWNKAVQPEPQVEEEETVEEIEEPVPVEDLMLPEISDEQRLAEKVREEVLRMIKDDPEGAALIVRSWLFEE